MTPGEVLIKQIAEKISARLDAGFTPDKDALHFLKTSCGVNEEGNLLTFLSDSSLNDGTIYELTIYPDEKFRLEIEKLIPPDGIPHPRLDLIINSLAGKYQSVSLITPAGKFAVDRESCLTCIPSFIKKLNLELDLQYLGDVKDSQSEELYYRSRALLRRRKFLPSGDRGGFMRRLVQHKPAANSSNDELINIIDRGVSFLSGTEEKAFDSLAAKKCYYESVISQCEEFAALLNTWGMEFLMMKKIQPPPVSVDEALESIRTIDRLTSIVYGIIIPASDMGVQISVNSKDRADGTKYPL